MLIVEHSLSACRLLFVQSLIYYIMYLSGSDKAFRYKQNVYMMYPTMNGVMKNDDDVCLHKLSPAYYNFMIVYTVYGML